MFDAFTKVVAQADARGQFISTSEIDALASVVSDSNKRLDAVNRISSNASTIVANAARELFAQQPALIAPGGNAYTSRRMAACLRDMEIILRYVTYSVFTGDASVMERSLPQRPSRNVPGPRNSWSFRGCWCEPDEELCSRPGE
jgi:phycocyanin beta chain